MTAETEKERYQAGVIPYAKMGYGEPDYVVNRASAATGELLLISHLLREPSAGAQMRFAPPVAALSRLSSASDIPPDQSALESETNHD